MKIDPYKHKERYLNWKEKVYNILKRSINIMDDQINNAVEYFATRLTRDCNITEDTLRGTGISPTVSPAGPWGAKEIVGIISEWDEANQWGYVERLLIISPRDFSIPVREVRKYLTNEEITNEERQKILKYCYDIKDILNDEYHMANPVTELRIHARASGF